MLLNWIIGSCLVLMSICVIGTWLMASSSIFIERSMSTMVDMSVCTVSGTFSITAGLMMEDPLILSSGIALALMAVYSRLDESLDDDQLIEIQVFSSPHSDLNIDHFNVKK